MKQRNKLISKYKPNLCSLFSQYSIYLNPRAIFLHHLIHYAEIPASLQHSKSTSLFFIVFVVTEKNNFLTLCTIRLCRKWKFTNDTQTTINGIPFYYIHIYFPINKKIFANFQLGVKKGKLYYFLEEFIYIGCMVVSLGDILPPISIISIDCTQSFLYSRFINVKKIKRVESREIHWVFFRNSTLCGVLFIEFSCILPVFGLSVCSFFPRSQPW